MLCTIGIMALTLKVVLNSPRAVTEAELEREITEALLTDPRTAEVKNFTFEWSGDELTVSFIIVNAAGVPAEIKVSLRG